MRIRLAGSAVADLQSGIAFYEKQSSGLGAYFLKRIQEDLDELPTIAGIQLPLYRDYRRMVSRRFPFLIFYTVEKTEIIVWHIVDGRRNPQWIRDHLRERC